MADRKPLLDLSTSSLVAREYITINGKPYELRSPEELSLLEYHRIGALGQSLQPLFQTEDLPADRWPELSEKLDTLVRLVLEAPEDVIGALRENHKLAIIQTFTGLLPKPKAQPAARKTLAPEPVAVAQGDGSGEPLEIASL